MFERLVGVGDTTYPWFEMVTGPTKRRVTDLHIEGYATDAGQNERVTIQVYPPGTTGLGRAWLALE
jgi:hypothetical protein